MFMQMIDADGSERDIQTKSEFADAVRLGNITGATLVRSDPLEKWTPASEHAKSCELVSRTMDLTAFLFGIQGRIGRGDWWRVQFLGGVALAVFSWGLQDLLIRDGNAMDPITFWTWIGILLLTILIIWVGFAVSVKRWHDRDKSGWWALIILVPIVGYIWSLIENGFLKGTEGPNRFGPDPLRLPLPPSDSSAPLLA